MSRWKSIVAGIALLTVLTIMVQNTDVVTVRLLLWQLHVSQILLIIMVALIGFAIGYLIALIRTTRKKAGPGPRQTIKGA